jgi:hypothetical protein
MEKPQSGYEEPKSEYSIHITKTPTHEHTHARARASDNGWRYYPKHVEQFPDVNCVNLHLAGYILEFGCHLVAVVQYTFTYKQYIEQHK